MFVWLMDYICHVYGEENKDVLWSKHSHALANGTKFLSPCGQTERISIFCYIQEILVFTAFSALVESFPSITSEGHLSQTFLRPWVCLSQFHNAVKDFAARLELGNMVKSESHFHQGVMDSPWWLPLNLQSQLQGLSSLSSKCKGITPPTSHPCLSWDMSICRKIIKVKEKKKTSNKPTLTSHIKNICKATR